MSSAGPDRVPSETVFHLRQAFKLALSMVLFYWLALWMNWDVPQYGGLAIVIISLGTSGATIEKGLMRFLGTSVGVLIGFLVLGLFNHDRWALLLAFAAYLALIGYFMQASRYSYAWYVAAFVPLVVWADNYPHFDSAFYFGVFRYLETTAGILIYTAVDLVFWPRQAGRQLPAQGSQFLSDACELLQSCRRQMVDDSQPAGGTDLQNKVVGSLRKVISTLQEAYLDTAAVRAQRRVWEAWRVQVSNLVDALVVFQESIRGTTASELGRFVPRLELRMEIIEKRFDRIACLWHERQQADEISDSADAALLQPLSFDESDSIDLEAGQSGRSTVTGVMRQMEALDKASRGLLQTLRVLAGLDRSYTSPVSPSRKHLTRLFGWERERLVQALFPPAAFTVAFFFWIFVNPPTGPKVPMFAAILSLVILRTPMNPLALLVVFLLSVFVVVAPIYWLVMPTLSTGFGLLCLIFAYSFLFGFLGGRSPALKSGPIIMFVTMTGISNQQAYSFTATVDGALMIIMGGGIMALVHGFFNPNKPK